MFYPLIFGFEGKEAAQRSIYKLTGTETPEEKMLKVESNRRALTSKSTTDLGYKIINEDYIEGHFHHIGLNFEHDRVNACVYCHGEIPHDKDKEIRSFLNMHSFSVSCELCHVDSKPKWKLAWFDVKSGEYVTNPSTLNSTTMDTWTLKGLKEVQYSASQYGAKISLYNESESEFFSTEDDMEIAEEYMKEYKSYSDKQRKDANTKMHDKVLKEPFECDYCHSRDQKYVNYVRLGYPPRRVKTLNDSAIVGMISKYKQFYFPDFIDGGSGRRK